VDACLYLHCLVTDFLYLCAFARRGPHRKQSFASIVASIRVYSAVAWQRVDQIRYNINIRYIYFPFLNILICIKIPDEGEAGRGPYWPLAGAHFSRGLVSDPDRYEEVEFFKLYLQTSLKLQEGQYCCSSRNLLRSGDLLLVAASDDTHLRIVSGTLAGHIANQTQRKTKMLCLFLYNKVIPSTGWTTEEWEFDSRPVVRDLFVFHDVRTGSEAHPTPKAVHEVKAAGTTHLCSVSRLRIRAFLLPLPHVPSWRSA
jgi:hypothetical protein